MRRLVFILAVAGACVACESSSSSTTGAQHPTSAAQHDAMATQKEQEAQEHLTAATMESTRHGWAVNHDAHRVEAEKLLQEAMEHRAASQALRDAQARACNGVPESDRDDTPFAHVEDITTVAPISDGSRLLGAKVGFRHVDGVTVQAFQEIVDCNVAEANALGHQVTEDAFDPLNLPGVKATVTAAGDGYEVSVVSDDAESAKEVLRRAQALKT